MPRTRQGKLGIQLGLNALERPLTAHCSAWHEAIGWQCQHRQKLPGASEFVFALFRLGAEISYEATKYVQCNNYRLLPSCLRA